jgi:hypothetical protein
MMPFVALFVPSALTKLPVAPTPRAARVVKVRV